MFTIWDVETGDQLTERTDYGLGGSHGFEFLPGEDRLMNLRFYGFPQSWDGTPMEQTVN